MKMKTMAFRDFALITISLLLTPLILVACASHPSIENPPTAASATVAPQSPNSFIYSFLTRGKYYLKKGDNVAALHELRKAYKTLKPGSSDSLRGIVLNDLGEALIASKNYKEAIPVCHSALLINLSCNNKIEATISHLNLGDAIEKSGNILSAIDHWEKAYDMAAKMGHIGLIKAAQTRAITPLSQF